MNLVILFSGVFITIAITAILSVLLDHSITGEVTLAIWIIVLPIGAITTVFINAWYKNRKNKEIKQ